MINNNPIFASATERGEHIGEGSESGYGIGSDRTPKCNDGKDNDGDRFIDLKDSGCANVNDNNENNDPSLPHPNPMPARRPAGDGGDSNQSSPKEITDTFVDADPVRSANEPSIAAHPYDPEVIIALHIASLEFEEGFPEDLTCDLHLSIDKGKTWSSPSQLPVPSINSQCVDPIIRWGTSTNDPSGPRVYAAYKTFPEDFSTSDIVLSYSDDKGLNWSDPKIVMEGKPGTKFIDKPWIATSGGPSSEDNVYVVGLVLETEETENPDNSFTYCSIVFAKSKDSGESYSEPTVLAESENCSPRLKGPVVAAFNDSILACWWDSELDGRSREDGTDGGLFDIKCSSSIDRGEIFSEPVTAVDDRNELSFYKCPDISYHMISGAMNPSLAITSNGVAHMVYAADPTADDFDSECGDIYYARSSEPWDEWTLTENQTRLNDDTTATFQGFASIVSKRVGNDDILMVAWEDSRNSADIREPNLIYDIFSTTITENGDVAPNKRVTELSSLSDYTFVGDYIDTSAHRFAGEQIAYVIWTDRRDKSDILDPEDDVAVDTIRLTMFPPHD